MTSNSFSQTVPQISVEELQQRLCAADSGLQLIDVREPSETDIAQIEGFVNLPLSQFARWSKQIKNNLDPHTETLVLCHHGIRSAHMCQWLIAQGFTNVKNIAGGIDAYSTVVDSSIPHY